MKVSIKKIILSLIPVFFFLVATPHADALTYVTNQCTAFWMFGANPGPCTYIAGDVTFTINITGQKPVYSAGDTLGISVTTSNPGVNYIEVIGGQYALYNYYSSSLSGTVILDTTPGNHSLTMNAGFLWGDFVPDGEFVYPAYTFSYTVAPPSASLSASPTTINSGGSATLTYSSQGISSNTTQTFTSSGSFTVPAGVTSLSTTVIGGGGGGSGLQAAGACGDDASSGGGGSGGVNTWSGTVSPGQSFGVTVGAGGLRAGSYWCWSNWVPEPNTGTSGDGADGGSSAFGGVVATGGGGGRHSVGSDGGLAYGAGGAAGSPGGQPGTNNGGYNDFVGSPGGDNYSGYGAGGTAHGRTPGGVNPTNGGDGAVIVTYSAPCTIDNGGGAVPANGNGAVTVSPTVTTTYTLSCNGFTAQATVTVNSTCTDPQGGTVASGGSVTEYQSATVPFGNSCVSESRTCTNGTLSGSYTNASCSVSGQADLVSSGITAPSAAVAEATISLSATVSNTGNLAAGSFSDDFTYRYGTSGAWNGMTGGTIPHGSLSGPGNANDGVSFAPPYAGDLYIQHCVDAYNEIAEGGNESPNCTVAGPVDVVNNPKGYLDSVSCAAKGVAGWTCDKDVNASIDVHIYNGVATAPWTNNLTVMTANTSRRSDADSSCGGSTASHGFNYTLSVSRYDFSRIRCYTNIILKCSLITTRQRSH